MQNILRNVMKNFFHQTRLWQSLGLSLGGLMLATLPQMAIAQTLDQDILELSQMLLEQPCTTYEKTDGVVRYSICMQEDGENLIVLSAASSLVDAGDGVGYWFSPEGGIVAIRFFHSGETFFFDPVSQAPLGAILDDGSVQTQFTQEEHETLVNLVQDISPIDEIFNVFLE